MLATRHTILLLCASLFSAPAFCSRAGGNGLMLGRPDGGEKGAKRPSPKSISGVPAFGPSPLLNDVEVPSTFVGDQPDPLASTLPQPSVPIFSSARGAAFAGQASVAQTGFEGECSTQSVSAGTAATGAQGAAQASVGGGASGTSACGDSKEPFQLGASFFNGFVVTGSVGFQAPGQPLDCTSHTVGSGGSTTFTRGNVKTSAAGHLTGSSECKEPKRNAGK